MEIRLNLPLPETQVFRYGAADEILVLLATNPNEVFTNRELREKTGYGGPSVSKALDLLVALDLLKRTDRKNRTEYRINGQRLTPRKGVAAIPQPEFQSPVRAFRERVFEQIEDLAGIIVFGSVARGEADRQSDIDVFVAVETDPPTDARRTVTDIVADLETERFDGERYGFDQHVESLDSMRRHGDQLTEILTDGIALYETPSFEARRTELLGRDRQE